MDIPLGTGLGVVKTEGIRVVPTWPGVTFVPGDGVSGGLGVGTSPGHCGVWQQASLGSCTMKQ